MHAKKTKLAKLIQLKENGDISPQDPVSGDLLDRIRLVGVQHDDIWIQEANGKRRRLFQGDKFNRGDTLFSYAVDAFRWSPNGRMFLAQLFTTSVVDEGGRTEDSSMTLAFEDGGKEIHFGNKGENLIKDCFNATWLLDNATIIYFEEAIKPHMLFSFRYTNISSGPAGLAFEGRTFIDSDRIPRTNAAIAVVSRARVVSAASRRRLRSRRSTASSAIGWSLAASAAAVGETESK